MNSDAKLEFLKALNKVQGIIEPAKMDKTNPHFDSRYASISSVNDAVLGPLNENGFILMQGGVDINGKPYLRTTLYHVLGHSEHFDYPLIEKADNPQHIASSTTYARRYSICALLALSVEDDDGNAATAGAKQSRAAASSVTAASKNEIAEGDGLLSFIPARVEFVDGKGKGLGKTFSEIFRADGVKFGGNEIQGEMAESALQNKQEVIVSFTKKGQYININREGLKIAEPKKSDIEVSF